MVAAVGAGGASATIQTDSRGRFLSTMQSKSVLVTQNCYIQLDRLAWVRGCVFCTLGAQKPPPRASRRAEKSENTQKRYETGRPYLKQKGPRSLCGPPTPPHGHIWPRQRLAHVRVDVEGRHERLYRPRPRTWDRTTAVSTSDL